jgi:serine/threonine protein phosphatase 1
MKEGRTFVVGDLHGCADELEVLLQEISPGDSDTVIFLGDYIDRGPSPRDVVDRVLRLQREGPACVFLKGNHEDMFLAFLGRGGRYGEAFLYNGGDATLRSYGLEGRTGDDAARRLPDEHLQFFSSLQLRAEHDGFLCVHAGVSPARGLGEQREEDLLWIREDFISHPHPFPFTVVYGHTPRREVHLDLPYKIGLDTGLVYGNKLSCLELGERRLFQIRRAQRDVEVRSLKDLSAAC